jgi:hypothetical protein
MSRFKGRVSARAIERDFPHVVETVVLKGGLGKTLVAMHEFHTLHGIDAHTGKGRRDKNAATTSDGASLIRGQPRSSQANSCADEMSNSSILDRGYSPTREQAMADFKAQWLGS